MTNKYNGVRKKMCKILINSLESALANIENNMPQTAMLAIKYVINELKGYDSNKHEPRVGVRTDAITFEFVDSVTARFPQ